MKTMLTLRWVENNDFKPAKVQTFLPFTLLSLQATAIVSLWQEPIKTRHVKRLKTFIRQKDAKHAHSAESAFLRLPMINNWQDLRSSLIKWGVRNL